MRESVVPYGGGDYEIRIKGRLSDSLLAAFEGLTATVKPVETVLHGPVQDQSSLHELLDRIQSLGLELVEIRRLPAAAEELAAEFERPPCRPWTAWLSQDGMHPGPSGRRPSRLPRREQSVLEGVLDLLAGLLQVALGLVGPTLGLQLVVIGGPAEPFFGLPLDLLGLVLGLVINAHGSILPRRAVLSCFPASHAPNAGVRTGVGDGVACTRMASNGGQSPSSRALDAAGGGQDDGVVPGPKP